MTYTFSPLHQRANKCRHLYLILWTGLAFSSKHLVFLFHQITQILLAGMVGNNLLISLLIFLPWKLNNNSLTVLGISSRFAKCLEPNSRSVLLFCSGSERSWYLLPLIHTQNTYYDLKYLFLWIRLSQAGTFFSSSCDCMKAGLTSLGLRHSCCYYY